MVELVPIVGDSAAAHLSGYPLRAAAAGDIIDLQRNAAGDLTETTIGPAETLLVDSTLTIAEKADCFAALRTNSADALHYLGGEPLPGDEATLEYFCKLDEAASGLGRGAIDATVEFDPGLTAIIPQAGSPSDTTARLPRIPA